MSVTLFTTFSLTVYIAFSHKSVIYFQMSYYRTDPCKHLTAHGISPLFFFVINHCGKSVIHKSVLILLFYIYTADHEMIPARVGVSGVVRVVLSVGEREDRCWWERQTILLLHACWKYHAFLIARSERVHRVNAFGLGSSNLSFVTKSCTSA